MEENRNTSENNVGGAGGNSNANNTAQILKWVCLGASIVVALSAVLPYVSALGINVTLLESGSGYIFILLAIVCAVFTFLKHQQQAIVILVCGVASFLWNLREMLAFVDADALTLSLVEKEIGYWLMFLSTLVLLIASIFNFIMSRKQGS